MNEKVMLDNMRFAHQRAGELLAALLADVEAGEVKESAALIDAFKPIHALRQTAQDCARDAANYVHPKLANIQHGSDPDNPLNAVTDADRAQVILAVLAENPKLLDQILKQLT
jgi:dihydrodipicolinate synthase/N-acetylneuraminate lyase